MAVENLTPTPADKLTSADQAMNLAGSISTLMRQAVASLEQFATECEGRAAAAEKRRSDAEAAITDLQAKLVAKTQVEADLQQRNAELAAATAKLNDVKAQAAEFQKKLAGLLV